MNDELTYKIIGIAGGIGSGKSTVTDYLRALNYPVYDADEIAREIAMPGEPTLEELVSVFGNQILETDGNLNRRKLAQIVFGDADKTKMLNDIMHSDITNRIDYYLNNYNGKKNTVFISAPLFFEVELEKKCDETWVVVADKEIRIKRAMDRDGLPRSEIIDRINRQMSDEERAEKADHILQNNGTKEELIEQVQKFMNITGI